ncbi:MAG: DUF2357 domain-containing protein [Clostridia bacterium]|nr:DUF2357 domain-containing protein [Clostridia bacterium]
MTVDLVSQLIQQGARCEDGVIRVESDSAYYLSFGDGDAPVWIEQSPLVARLGGGLGLFELNLVNCVGRLRLGPVELDVECAKLTPVQFRTMVDDVSGYLAQLPFSHKGAGSSYERAAESARPIDYHILVYVSNLLRSNLLQAAVAQVVADPHVSFVKQRQHVRVERAHRADSVTVRDICANPRRFEPIRPGSALAASAISIRLEGKPLAGHFPGSVLSSTMIPAVDNPENQFVRHVLESILLVASSVTASVRCTSDIRAEACRVQDGVERLLAYDLFREVSPPRALSLSSQVLQRKAGYREMLTYHSQMMLPPTPAWPDDLERILELKDAAALYEYWVFIQVCKAVEEAAGARSTQASAVANCDPLGVRLARGIRVQFPGDVEVSYNRQFAGYSGPFRPDVTLATPAGMWVFDAKFRLDRKSGFDDSAKVDDICKMHSYRDALPGCRGAYAVYPGDEELMYPAPGGEPSVAVCDRAGSAACVAIDGVGAIPARPGGASA